MRNALARNPKVAESKRMNFVVPVPSETFDVVLEDGASIRVRRHGNRDGVRLTVTHGNGFAVRRLSAVLAAADAALRRAGVRLPQSWAECSGRARQPQLRAIEPRSRARARCDRLPARQEDHGRHFPFHVGAHRDEARHRDRLALGRAGSVRSAQRSAGRPSPLPADGSLREAADGVGARPPPPVCLGGGAGRRNISSRAPPRAGCQARTS